jgi:hypothetical protein
LNYTVIGLVLDLVDRIDELELILARGAITQRPAGRSDRLWT